MFYNNVVFECFNLNKWWVYQLVDRDGYTSSWFFGSAGVNHVNSVNHFNSISPDNSVNHVNSVKSVNSKDDKNSLF